MTKGSKKELEVLIENLERKKKKKKAVEAAMCSCFLLELHRRSTSRKMV